MTDQYPISTSRDKLLFTPGPLTTSRIGSIGRIFPSDVRALLAAIRETMAEMSVG